MESTFLISEQGCTVCNNQVLKTLGTLQGVFGAVIDSIDGCITVSHTGEVKREEISAKLFHFNRVIESDDVISQIDRAGFRQATLMEFLAFAIAYPDLQRKFSVSAFGSTWSDDSGCLCMPWISTVHDESIISPLKLKGEYSAYWRFLAVSK